MKLSLKVAVGGTLLVSALTFGALAIHNREVETQRTQRAWLEAAMGERLSPDVDIGSVLDASVIDFNGYWVRYCVSGSIEELAGLAPEGSRWGLGYPLSKDSNRFPCKPDLPVGTKPIGEYAWTGPRLNGFAFVVWGQGADGHGTLCVTYEDINTPVSRASDNF